jgi:hypothetical protein
VGSLPPGRGIQVGFTTAGQAFGNGLEPGFDQSISGISTAGPYFASGLSALVTQLNAIGLTTLADAVSSLTPTQINQVVDQIGSALCDAVQDVACLFGSAFSFVNPAIRFVPTDGVYGVMGSTRLIGPLSGFEISHPVPTMSSRAGCTATGSAKRDLPCTAIGAARVRI